MKARIKAVLAKKETTYGTDATPTGAADAIEVVESSIEPLSAEEVEHNVDRPILGNYLSSLVGKHVVLTFKVAIAGSGVNTTPPAWGTLLKGCGMSETVGVSDVTYAPMDSNEDSLSLYFYTAQGLHKLLGARGNWQIAPQAKQIPYFEFTFTGMLVAPATATLPTLTLTAFTYPLAVSNANTSFSIHAQNEILRALSFSPNNEVAHLDLPNTEEVMITGRAPGGDLTIDAPALATKDYFATVQTSTTGAMILQHGQSAGNIVTFNGAQTQLSSIANTDNDGELGHQMNMRMIPTSAGLDDYTVVTS